MSLHLHCSLQQAHIPKYSLFPGSFLLPKFVVHVQAGSCSKEIVQTCKSKTPPIDLSAQTRGKQPHSQTSPHRLGIITLVLPSLVQYCSFDTYYSFGPHSSEIAQIVLRIFSVLQNCRFGHLDLVNAVQFNCRVLLQSSCPDQQGWVCCVHVRIIQVRIIQRQFVIVNRGLGTRLVLINNAGRVQPQIISKNLERTYYLYVLLG